MEGPAQQRKNRLLPTLVVLATIAFAFNNCSKLPQKNSSTNLGSSTRTNAGTNSNTKSPSRTPANFKESSSKSLALNSPTTGTQGRPTCSDSRIYKCVSQTFSSDVANSSADGEFACVTLSDGSALCPSGTISNYNTTGAKELCAQRHCKENFEYSEYFCNVNMKGEIAASSSRTTDLVSALQSAYDSCLKMINN